MIRAVLFDAAGTLIEVAEPVGETYARFAAREGVITDAAALGTAFRAAFADAPPLAFTGLTAEMRAEREREWWRRVVFAAFGAARAEGPPEGRARAFDALFAHFATAEAWRVFPDVRPTLASLRALGARLAVVSNFDARLRIVLDRLGLAAVFDAVVLSSECGFAKPDARIFAEALRSVRAAPETTLHVGDSAELDVEAAQAAGLSAVRVDRSRRDAQAIADLRELLLRIR